MSAEQRFQGYSLDRNSSKVMAPPGGKSSISFGFGDPEPPKPAPVRAAPARAAPAQQASSAAAPAAAAPAAAAPAAAAPAAPAPVAAAPAAATNPTPAAPAVDNTPAGTRVQQVDRFEKEHQVSSCQMARNRSNVFSADTEARRQAVKIKNPPGGTSSISFG